MNILKSKELKINYQKKLIIFDYDGTIADTNDLHANAFKSTLEDYIKILNIVHLLA